MLFRIMLEALEKTGYTLLHHGIEGAGALFHLLRGGGHYLGEHTFEMQ